MKYNSELYYIRNSYTGETLEQTKARLAEKRRQRLDKIKNKSYTKEK
jgi:hypothetical protein